ncbi:hypothetical protein HK102_012585 [Quaeritorhiza haematococci]|nr:hypothetical protein HK102_012585 [Quaeritorhiza haematococci]
MCDLGKGTRTATHATSCSASRGGSHHSDADGGLSDALAFLITALPPSVVSLVGARQLIAFMLAFIASMGTFLGGIFVVILAQFRKSNATSTAWLVGVLQAFSGGVMLYMTFLDLIPESIEVIGGRETMIWFFVGVAVFGFLETYVVPEEHDHGDGEHDAAHEPSDDNSSNSAADGKESNTVATSDSTGLRNRKKSKSSDDSDKRKDAIKPSSGTSKREGGELSQKERRDLLRTSLITFLAMGLQCVHFLTSRNAF